MGNQSRTPHILTLADGTQVEHDNGAYERGELEELHEIIKEKFKNKAITISDTLRYPEPELSRYKLSLIQINDAAKDSSQWSFKELNQLSHLQRLWLGAGCWNKWISSSDNDCKAYVPFDGFLLNKITTQLDNLEGYEFNGQLRITNVVFSNLTRFNKCIFADSLAIEHSIFLSPFSITKPEINTGLYIQDTHMNSVAIHGGTLLGNVRFHTIKASGEFSISNINIEEQSPNAWVSFQFHNIEVNDGYKLSNVNHLNELTVDNSIFYAEANFSNLNILKRHYVRHSKFEKAADYEGAVFHTDVPDFTKATFKYPVNVRSITLPSPKDKSQIDRVKINPTLARELPRRYHWFKRQAEQSHDHYKEAELYRYELLSSIGVEATAWHSKFLIRTYEVTSKCGMSISRPLIWWLGFMVLFAAVYAISVDWPLSDLRPIEIGQVFSVSLSNSLPILGTAKAVQSAPISALFGGYSNVGFWLSLTMFGQNIISTFFIFLTLLSIRNHFKLR